jgi:GntR family transcriptional regulator
VRELSAQLKINPLTVAKVYQLLQQEGLVELQRGRGTYVAHPSRPRSLAERRRLIAPAVRQLVAEAQHLQIDRDELYELIEGHLREVTEA